MLQSEFLYAAFYDARFECNNSRLRIVNNNSALEQREGTRLRTISIAPQKEISPCMTSYDSAVNVEVHESMFDIHRPERSEDRRLTG